MTASKVDTDLKVRVLRAAEVLRPLHVGQSQGTLILLIFALRRATSIDQGFQLSIPERAQWSTVANGSTKRIAYRLRKACQALDKANPSVFSGAISLLSRGIETDGLAYEATNFAIRRLIQLWGTSRTEYEAGQWRVAAESISRLLRDPRHEIQSVVPSYVFSLLSRLQPYGRTLFFGSVSANLEGLNAVADAALAHGSKLFTLTPASYMEHEAASKVLAWLGGSAFSCHDDATARSESNGTVPVEYDCLFGMLPTHPSRFSKRRISPLAHGRVESSKPVIRHDLELVRWALSHTAPAGRGFIVTNNGFLFSGGQDHSLRRDLVQKDLIEAVIPLPPRLTKGGRALTSMLVLAKKKRAGLQNKVRFIYPSRAPGESSTPEDFSVDEMEALVRALTIADKNGGRHQSESYVKLVSTAELEQCSYNLDPKRHCDLPGPRISSVELPDSIDKLIQERNALELRVRKLLDGLRASVGDPD